MQTVIFSEEKNCKATLTSLSLIILFKIKEKKFPYVSRQRKQTSIEGTVNV